MFYSTETCSVGIKHPNSITDICRVLNKCFAYVLDAARVFSSRIGNSRFRFTIRYLSDIIERRESRGRACPDMTERAKMSAMLSAAG